MCVSSSLIKKYYAKRDQLEQTEKNLFESKEECKKVCIDYRNTLETCAKLENVSTCFPDIKSLLLCFIIGEPMMLNGDLLECHQDLYGCKV